MVNLTKEMWAKFAMGDKLSLEEVRALLKQLLEAIPYLHDRVDVLGTLPLADAVHSQLRLKEIEKELVKTAKVIQDLRDLRDSLPKGGT